MINRVNAVYDLLADSPSADFASFASTCDQDVLKDAQSLWLVEEHNGRLRLTPLGLLHAFSQRLLKEEDYVPKAKDFQEAMKAHCLVPEIVKRALKVATSSQYERWDCYRLLVMDLLSKEADHAALEAVERYASHRRLRHWALRFRDQLRSRVSVALPTSEDEDFNRMIDDIRIDLGPMDARLSSSDTPNMPSRRKRGEMNKRVGDLIAEFHRIGETVDSRTLADRLKVSPSLVRKQGTWRTYRSALAGEKHDSVAGSRRPRRPGNPDRRGGEQDQSESD